MLESQLTLQLKAVGRRIQRLWMWKKLTWVWWAFALLTGVWALAGRPVVPGFAWILLSGIAGLAVWLSSRVQPFSGLAVARQIEQAFPDLKARLLAALEQTPDLQTGRFNLLQRQVIAEAVHHSRMNDWSDAIPTSTMTRAFVYQSLALMSLIAVGLFAMQAGSKSAAALTDTHRVPAVLDGSAVTVEPGNTEIERGSSMLVLARFSESIPAEVHVIWRESDGDEHRLSLSKSLDDPVFAVRLPEIHEQIEYWIEFDNQRTDSFRATVYDLPALVRSDLTLQFPEYTKLEKAILQDAFETTVVEGTRVGIACKVNIPLSTATLVGGDDSVFELKVTSDPTVYEFDFIPDEEIAIAASPGGRFGPNES